jgi:hypothetical protein
MFKATNSKETCGIRKAFGYAGEMEREERMKDDEARRWTSNTPQQQHAATDR